MFNEDTVDEADSLTEKIQQCIEENTFELPFVGGKIDSVIVCSLVDLLEKLIAASSLDNDDFRNRLKFVDNCVLHIGGIIDCKEFNNRMGEFVNKGDA